MEAGDVLLNWKEWLLATDSMNPAALSEDLGYDLGCAVASQKVPGSIEKDQRTSDPNSLPWPCFVLLSNLIGKYVEIHFRFGVLFVCSFLHSWIDDFFNVV